MFKFLSFLLLFMVLAFDVNCENLETKVYFESIKNNENAFRILNPDFDHYLNFFDLVLNENGTNLSNECRNNLKTLRRGLVDKEEWALRIYESNGRPKNGFLLGLNHDLGSLDQCLNKYTNTRFENQFCLVSLKSKEFIKKVKNQESYIEMEANIQHQLTKDLIDFSFGTVIGTCLPRSCDRHSILSTINKALSKYELEGVVQKHCTFKSDKTFLTTEVLVAWAVISTLAVLCLSTLFFDSKFLRPFSLKKNFEYVYNTNSTSSECFLSGFKVFYILISVPAHFFGLSHTVGIATFFSDSLKEAKSNIHWVFLEILERLALGIDVIVFYTGFCMFLIVYDHIKQNRTNFFKSMAFFVISVYPIFIGFIAVVFSFGYFVDGPFVPDVLLQYYNLFWNNSLKLLTFTSNLDAVPEQLIIFNWFNSVMVQLFVIFYFIMYLFTKNDKLGFLATGIVLCLNFVYVGYVMVKQNIPPFIKIISGDSIYFHDFGKDYMYFYNHLDAYAVGFITGYLYKYKKVSFLKNSFVFYSLYVITFAASLSAFYTPKLFETGILPDIFALKLLYFVFKRFCFAMFPAFLVLCFRANYLKSFNNVLSWKYFLPLSRMASAFASCQFFYYFYWYFSSRTTIRFSLEVLIKESLCELVALFFIGNLFFFFIELPLMNTFRLLFVGELRINKAIFKGKHLDENENKLDSKDVNENLRNVDDLNESKSKKIR